MKTPPLMSQRQTPSWQPPPPQRPHCLSIGLFLFSESNLPHVSSQKPRSDRHLPTPSGASLRHVGQAPGPAQGRTTWLAWGQSTFRTLSATLTAFCGSYFYLSQRGTFKPAAENPCPDLTTPKTMRGREKSGQSERQPPPLLVATACLWPNSTAPLPVASEVRTLRMRPT